jgi:hypothetical protein
MERPTVDGNDRLRARLADGPPIWLADALQVSIDYRLSVLTPLNLLFVLLEEPAPATEAFLARHGLERDALRELLRSTLTELGRRVS